MNFSMGGKRKKTKGSVFGADKDEEAERKAVQQKRAQELGFSAWARSAAPSARAAASASSSGEPAQSARRVARASAARLDTHCAHVEPVSRLLAAHTVRMPGGSFRVWSH